MKRGLAAIHAACLLAACSHASVASAESLSNGEVSLAAILGYADVHSPFLGVARSKRAYADAARAEAGPVFPANPELTIAVGPRFSDGHTGIDVQASLMQEVEIAGQRGLRFEAAERLQERTEAEVEEARWAVHCEVHAVFHRALVERERASLAKRVATFHEEVLRVVEQQVQAGEAAELTLRLARAERAQAEQSLVQAEQSFWSARMKLGQLAGWSAAQPPNPIGELEAPRDPPSQHDLVAMARKHLPSLRAGAAAIHETQARAVLADRESWVNPSIGVQYTHESSLQSEPGNDILLGVLAVPIPGFRSNEGERARARAELTVAHAALHARRAVLEGDIARAHSEVIAALKRTRTYGDDILPSIQENLMLLRRGYELGELDIMALSIGRERFLRIQSDALGAQLDYVAAVAELERIVGVDLTSSGAP
jgi:cobalt-zinc-cadmium efflux system outer membrane protein